MEESNESLFTKRVHTGGVADGCVSTIESGVLFATAFVIHLTGGGEKSELPGRRGERDERRGVGGNRTLSFSIT